MENPSPRASYPHLCYAGLSILMLVLVFPCLMVAMFEMEAPWRYLTATQVLYPIVLALYILHILSDLAIITWSRKNRIKIRTVLAVSCPALGAILSLPTMGMLAYTKNKGGFTSSSADAALIFAVIVVIVQLLHVLLAAWLYWAYCHKESCLGLVNLPCCTCFLGNVPDENLQLPSAGEPEEMAVNQTVGPGYIINRLDSVEFHRDQSGVVLNRWDSQVSPSQTTESTQPGDKKDTAVPEPIPPPPPVERAKRKPGPTGTRHGEEEGNRSPCVLLPSDIDVQFGPEPYNPEIEREFGEIAERQESLRAEVEVDYPSGEIDVPTDKDNTGASE